MGRIRQARPARARIFTLMLVVWMVAGTGPSPALARQASPSTLDIPAVLLQPADLEAEGLPAMPVHIGRVYTTVDDAMAAVPYARSQMMGSLADVPEAEGTLRSTGWQRFHEVMLADAEPLPADVLHQDVTSGIQEHATAEGAAAAFDALGTADVLVAASLVVPSQLTLATPLGEQSRAWRTTYANGNGVISNSVTIWARLGSRILAVSVEHHTVAGVPDQAVAERLMARLITRVQVALGIGAPGSCLPGAGGTSAETSADPGGAITAAFAPHLPGLSSCALLLTAPGSYPARAYYTRMDDTELRLSEYSDAEFAEAQASYDSLGVVDSYLLQITIPAVTLGGDDGLVFYTTRIERFDGDIAFTGMLDELEASRQANTDEPLVSFDHDVISFGDESATFVYRAGGGAYVTTTVVLIGDLQIMTRVSSATEPVPEVVESLAAAQYTCMMGGSCAVPLPVPPRLLGAGSDVTAPA